MIGMMQKHPKDILHQRHSGLAHVTGSERV